MARASSRLSEGGHDGEASPAGRPSAGWSAGRHRMHCFLALTEADRVRGHVGPAFTGRNEGAKSRPDGTCSCAVDGAIHEAFARRAGAAVEFAKDEGSRETEAEPHSKSNERTPCPFGWAPRCARGARRPRVRRPSERCCPAPRRSGSSRRPQPASRRAAPIPAPVNGCGSDSPRRGRRDPRQGRGLPSPRAGRRSADTSRALAAAAGSGLSVLCMRRPSSLRGPEVTLVSA